MGEVIIEKILPRIHLIFGIVSKEKRCKWISTQNTNNYRENTGNYRKYW